MPKFRKKPVVIEAIQFDGGNYLEIEKWSNGEVFTCQPKPCLQINTLEGTMLANRGDWIIKGVNGEFYPCKPDIFEATYDEVIIPEPSQTLGKNTIPVG